MRRRLQDFHGGVPVNGSVERRQMLVFLAVIVVQVHRGHQIAQGLEAFRNAFFRRAIGEIRMTDIKVEAQAREARFVDEGA